MASRDDRTQDIGAPRHNEAECEFGSSCPLASVHARLQEGWLMLRHARDAYSDPTLFRSYLNACIQALRNSTWVLQKQKAQMREFDTWYGRWQETMKDEPVLRWLVEARNRVVKEGDL